ncbi:hypothetical protein GYH30_037234, partial [Glycine max]
PTSNEQKLAQFCFVAVLTFSPNFESMGNFYFLAGSPSDANTLNGFVADARRIEAPHVLTVSRKRGVISPVLIWIRPPGTIIKFASTPITYSL